MNASGAARSGYPCDPAASSLTPPARPDPAGWNPVPVGIYNQRSAQAQAQVAPAALALYICRYDQV
jgi:hypothetical protein